MEFSPVPWRPGREHDAGASAPSNVVASLGAARATRCRDTTSAHACEGPLRSRAPLVRAQAIAAAENPVEQPRDAFMPWTARAAGTMSGPRSTAEYREG